MSSPALLRDFPDRGNSLNALRLILATLVIVSHSWPIGGFGHDPQLGQLTLGRFSVAGFFAISGWLITQSRLSTTLPSYLWRRFLRIYPAFVIVLFVVAFGFAPIAAALGAGEWALDGAVKYVVWNAPVHIGEFAVAGTPSAVPYPGQWNGSLWTLFYEILCYLLIGACVSVARRWLTPTVLVLWVGVTAAHLTTEVGGVVAPFLELAPYFLAGATLYLLRSRVPLHWAGGLAAAFTAAGLIGLGAVPVLAALPLAYLMLWLGAVLPLRRVGRRNDISYGMYVYAFPMQQMLAIAGAARWGVAGFVVASIVCTVPLAVASWYLVEKPTQRFRRAADALSRDQWGDLAKSVRRRLTLAAAPSLSTTRRKTHPVPSGAGGEIDELGPAA